MTHNINLACLLDRDTLLVIAERACTELAFIASAAMVGECTDDDREKAENDIGLLMDEIVEMEHDNHIERARNVLRSIMREFPQTRTTAA